MVSISGGATASFRYDPFGRRTLKTVGAVTTQFLYDGANSVQEQDGGGSVLANLLTGLRVDEYFARADSLGTYALLTDR